MRPKKSYGQHFLTSPQIAERIVDSLENNGLYEDILEIGPGKGVLTQFLMRRPERLLLVEADSDMAEYLEDSLENLNGEVLHFDFLRFNPKKYYEDKPFGLIGNFPYNISSQIIFRMIKFRDQIPEMVGMFQKEVAERIVATQEDKAYGVISLLVQAFYEGKILFKVDAGSFFPPPKVKSAVIRLVRKPEDSLGCDYSLFRQVVKAAFGQRRKMLRNTMKTFLKGDPILQDAFFTRRPESLSLPEFVELTNLVEKTKKRHESERQDQ